MFQYSWPQLTCGTPQTSRELENFRHARFGWSGTEGKLSHNTNWRQEWKKQCPLLRSISFTATHGPQTTRQPFDDLQLEVLKVDGRQPHYTRTPTDTYFGENCYILLCYCVVRYSLNIKRWQSIFYTRGREMSTWKAFSFPWPLFVAYRPQK